MDDLISRQAAIDAPEKLIKDCNPDHFVGHQKFIEFMDNTEIGSFGNWQFANGFNMGLTAAEVTIKNLPSADAVPVVRCKDCRYFHKSPTIMGDERDDGWCEWIAERLVGQNHYCSWGTERSEDAAN